MTDINEIIGGRRLGKTAKQAAAISDALDRGAQVFVAARDQSADAERLSRHLPGTLFEVVGKSLLKPHRRRGKR